MKVDVGKAHHGKFFTNTNPIWNGEGWQWTQKGKKKGGGRGMFTSAQDKSLRTNKVHQENILDISEK